MTLKQVKKFLFSESTCIPVISVAMVLSQLHTVCIETFVSIVYMHNEMSANQCCRLMEQLTVIDLVVETEAQNNPVADKFR